MSWFEILGLLVSLVFAMIGIFLLLIPPEE